MTLGTNVVSAPCNGAVTVQNECRAHATEILSAVVLLNSPCAKQFVQASIGIHEQWEIEFLLGDELFMTGFRIF